MITRKSAFSVVILTDLLICPKSSTARDITNAGFLTWPEARQTWWVLSSVTMAGHVARLRDEAKGDCIWDWYLADPEARFAAIQNTMRQYPDHLPTGIIIAWLEKHCGGLSD